MITKILKMMVIVGYVILVCEMTPADEQPGTLTMIVSPEGATVLIDGRTHENEAKKAGVFEFTLNPGDYTVTISNGGFETKEIKVTIETEVINMQRMTLTHLPIILFSFNKIFSGELRSHIGGNGRESADSLCRLSPNRPYGYSYVIAFISSPDNEIKDLPAKHGVPTDIPIKSKSNVLLANNWHDLLDGEIATTLFNAGVLPSEDALWWSGSTDKGEGHHGCNDWRYDGGKLEVEGDELLTVEGYGTQGRANATVYWMGFTLAVPCHHERYILCIAY